MHKILRLTELISRCTVILVLYTMLPAVGRAQAPFYSLGRIKYNYEDHQTDKPIPFDKAFTLFVEKVGNDKIIAVHAYESSVESGERDLKVDNPASGASVVDMDLKFKVASNNLEIYFPPLKPNKLFDVNIISNLSDKNMATLLDVIYLTANNKFVEANTLHDESLRKSLIDKITRRTYYSYNYNNVKDFYQNQLSNLYTQLKRDQTEGLSLVTANNFTLAEYQAINIDVDKDKWPGSRIDYMVEVFERNKIEDVQLGLTNIANIYTSKYDNDILNIGERVKCIKSNIAHFDSIDLRINNRIARGYEVVRVGGANVRLSDVKKHVDVIRVNLFGNLSKLEKTYKKIVKEINDNCYMKEGFYLSGNTLASDLKTAGGNVLFLDAGLTTIVTRNATDNWVGIPRLYWGVSIYFRPIDKNTRQNTFAKKIAPFSSGCLKTTDNNIVATRNILQRLSLNVGFTLGGIPNKQFDNLYNNTSLLVGPSYRFARAFKISAGGSLLRRTSPNPIVSEKKVTPGAYVSVSTDVDFVQGLKDVTNILFK